MLKNPAIINTIAKQFNVNPAAGLPKPAGFTMPSLTGNPISKLPSVVGDNNIVKGATKLLGDNSIVKDATKLLGGK